MISQILNQQLQVKLFGELSISYIVQERGTILMQKTVRNLISIEGDRTDAGETYENREKVYIQKKDYSCWKGSRIVQGQDGQFIFARQVGSQFWKHLSHPRRSKVHSR